MNIFIKIVKENNWEITNDLIATGLFEKNKEYFINNGGDMETLFHLSKINHSNRVLYLPFNEKKKINITDLEKSIKLFLKDKEKKESETFYNLYS